MPALLDSPVTTIEHAMDELALWAIIQKPHLSTLIEELRAEVENGAPTRIEYLRLADRILDALENGETNEGTDTG